MPVSLRIAGLCGRKFSFFLRRAAMEAQNSGVFPFKQLKENDLSWKYPLYNPSTILHNPSTIPYKPSTILYIPSTFWPLPKVYG